MRKLERKIEKTIIKSQRIEIGKLAKRLMSLEMRVSEFEDQLLWQAEFENRSLDRQETLEKLQKKFKRLQESINTIELEKMIFDPD